MHAHRKPPKSPPAAERSRHLFALRAEALTIRPAAAHLGWGLGVGVGVGVGVESADGEEAGGMPEPPG